MARRLPPRLVAYRPFDERWSEFSSLTMDYPRRELLAHVAGRANLTLLAPRGISTQGWRHAFIADKPANDCVISNFSREANQVFPLWSFGSDGTKQENLSAAFRAFLDASYDHPLTPEEIFGYIYAVLHAPTYRSRYAEFLRIDFPRVPFPEAAEPFESLSVLGWALVQAHLLRELPRRKLATYHGKGDHLVEAVRYVPADEAIAINETQFFRPVPRGGLELPHRRLPGARQVPEVAQGPRAVAQRDQPCRCNRRQPRLHHRADAKDRRSLSCGVPRPVALA